MFGILYKDGFLCEIRFVSIHKIMTRFFGGAIPGIDSSIVVFA